MLVSDCTLQFKYQVINFSGFQKHFVSILPTFVFKGEVLSWTSASSSCGSIWVATNNWGTDAMLVTELCEDLMPAFLAFGQQFNILIQITWLSLPRFPSFVIPLTSGQTFPRYLLVESSYVKWEKNRRYLWNRCTQNLLIWPCLPWRFSSPAFWMTFILSAGTAELGYRGTFYVMTRSSSWHGFISRHMSFPGMPWLPTCVFAKHLARRHVVMYQIY